VSTQRAFDFIPPATVKDAMSFPIARRLDPETSKEAALEITASGRREGQALTVLAFVRKYPGKTSSELAVKAQTSGCPYDRYVFARRLPELEKAGLVWKRNSRQCSVSGLQAHTWESL
jgi:hypothetical protein